MALKSGIVFAQRKDMAFKGMCSLCTKEVHGFYGQA